MISGIDLNATTKYELKNDKDPKTAWKLSAIPSSVYARVLTEMTGAVQLYTLVQLSLKGWENRDAEFNTEKQRIFGREFDVVPISTLDVIDQASIAELAVAVMEFNKLSDKERGNS